MVSAFVSYLVFFILKITSVKAIILTSTGPLHQICRVGRTMAVDERAVVSFRSLKGRCSSNQFLLVLSASIHRIGFVCHLADGGIRQEVQELTAIVLVACVQTSQKTSKLLSMNVVKTLKMAEKDHID